ncbi:hypothetical protein A2J03_19620 [Rhodococcus sp. EPR-157]|jgi:signal transduction histidine kinase|nr:hypothetical protein A2J03_19620 [Rhodococcus sp. EPR-157]OLT32976.1 hypothetical protein BJF84_24490 [Rhodococcus sp. CUA-806]OLT33867.1 hypothetical protein BJF84_21140 [Rhodococcus sp. CUA-806]
MNAMLERLQVGQRAQQRFVSDASHELRSPLSPITAALELAASRPDLLNEALIDESLLPEARRMRQLIEDLLLLARSDETVVGIAPVDVDLDDLLYEEGKRIEALSDIARGRYRSPTTGHHVTGTFLGSQLHSSLFPRRTHYRRPRSRSVSVVRECRRRIDHAGWSPMTSPGLHRTHRRN